MTLTLLHKRIKFAEICL